VRSKKAGQAEGSRQGGQPLAHPHVEAEPHRQQHDEEEQLGGEEGLHLGESPEVQGNRLEQEGSDHEAEPRQPDATAQRMGEQRQLERGVVGRVLEAHPLQNAGQRIGQRCTQREEYTWQRRLYGPGSQRPAPTREMLQFCYGDCPSRGLERCAWWVNAA